jgi:hypothetical protein
MGNKFLLVILFLLILAVLSMLDFFIRGSGEQEVDKTQPFLYTFNVEGELQESANSARSASPYWWLNSGGIMLIKNSKGHSNQGELNPYSKWRILYNFSNPSDTDYGYRPQNIFRLVTRSKWDNFQEEAYFKINKDNLSESSNRNQSNGILFFLRYLDGDNLYYAGVRVDGTAVIKKKVRGEYFTLSQNILYDGEYNRNTNPSLLPKNTWIGLRAEINNVADNSVAIHLFVDEGGRSEWKLATVAIDKGELGGYPILDEGFAGIRADFMDIEFKDFKITSLSL